ncbi:MAG: hypothetical protein LBK43_10210, partial [Treponema sp.]|nr:hypothetical protein [Treponema sp.]
YIKNGKLSLLEEFDKGRYRSTIKEWLIYFHAYYKHGEYKKNSLYDIICITTLFTFYYSETINTINASKCLVKDERNIYVGGIMASVMPDAIKKETNITPHIGLLNKPGVLDDNNYIIDDLPLDYSILHEIDYPADNAFYAYSTRGCIRKCSFCAVPILEPQFEKFIPILKNIEEVRKTYGDRPNLLLLDNNVLASRDCFSKIIEEIKKAGFQKGAVFKMPNYFELYYNNLKKGLNDKAYTKALFYEYLALLDKLSNNEKQIIYELLKNNNLLNIYSASKKALLELYDAIKPYYELHINNSKKKRIVDFNQGIDARLINEENAQLLSEIAIEPLRLAFDHWSDKTIYANAVEICARHSIKSMSNYLLYNENDKPIELYKRLKINISLCEKLKISIYSFPMKYHPIKGDFSQNRDFIGKYWNRKYIRAVQTILNATKGKIGRGKSFFYKAFGKNEKEFKLLLVMPEPYILYRFFFEYIGYSQDWLKDYQKLDKTEKYQFLKLIAENKFSLSIYETLENEKIKKIYSHYLITRSDVINSSTNIGKRKIEYDEKKNTLKNLPIGV